MYIESAILGAFEDARRDEQTERDGNNEIQGLAMTGGRLPAGKGRYRIYW